MEKKWYYNECPDGKAFDDQEIKCVPHSQVPGC